MHTLVNLFKSYMKTDGRIYTSNRPLLSLVFSIKCRDCNHGSQKFVIASYLGQAHNILCQEQQKNNPGKRDDVNLDFFFLMYGLLSLGSFCLATMIGNSSTQILSSFSISGCI